MHPDVGLVGVVSVAIVGAGASMHACWCAGAGVVGVIVNEGGGRVTVCKCAVGHCELVRWFQLEK